jgi:hypothetical protein
MRERSVEIIKCKDTKKILRNSNAKKELSEERKENRMKKDAPVIVALEPSEE